MSVFSRLEALRYVIDGFAKTNVPLVLYDGNNLVPFTTLDDTGIYVLIPKLVRTLGISLSYAMPIFFYGLTLAAFTLAFIGISLLYRSFVARSFALIAFLFLFCFIMRYAIHDVYIAYSVTILSIIPLFIYGLTKKIVQFFLTVFWFFQECSWAPCTTYELIQDWQLLFLFLVHCAVIKELLIKKSL